MIHPPYASYLLRLWQESSEQTSESQWRLEVESVQTGQKWRLESLQDLLEFIQAEIDVHSTDFYE
jgi:hypothetical protein